MEHIQSMSQDSAAVFLEELTELRSDEVGGSTVYQGKTKNGKTIFVIFPATGDAIVIPFNNHFNTDT